MDLNQLFDQFVGGGTRTAAPQGKQAHDHGGASGVTGMLANLNAKAPGGFAGGMAAGGVLGVLMGNKKMRKKASKMEGVVVGYGGSAVLGALALKAYQNWQAGKNSADAAQSQSEPLAAFPAPEKFDPALQQDADGQPMQLTLVKSMIAAANADGHIDPTEQAAIFETVDKVELDAESKALIFDVLRNPPSVSQIAGYASGLEQASEIYLASRLAIDPDQPSERQYLRNLASAMSLPDGLVREIEAEFEPTPAPTSGAAQFGRNARQPTGNTVPIVGAGRAG